MGVAASSRASADLERWLATALDGGQGPVLIHSDLGRVLGPAGGARSRDEVLEAHMCFLRHACGDRPVWMPTFNYGFTTSGRYDVEHDRSEVGALTEHFRREVAEWRSATPIFSLAGSGDPVELEGGSVIDPFDEHSGFAELSARKGTLLFYGADLSSCTFVHHVERLSGGPTYRYDKLFTGSIRTGSHDREVVVRYHVRPLGRDLQYDWHRLARDLEGAGLLAQYGGGLQRASVIDAQALADFWCRELTADPLHLLEPSTRAWVDADLERLGRGFRLEDFEEPRR